MQINFYTITDDPRKVEKTLGTALATATGVLHERVNNLSMSVQIPSSFFNTVVQSNYVGIDTTGKHYFLESYDIRNDCVIINLKQDVLYNYATQIKALQCTVDRSASVWQGFLYDNGYHLLAYKTAAIRNFPNGIESDSMILTTVG